MLLRSKIERYFPGTREQAPFFEVSFGPHGTPEEVVYRFERDAAGDLVCNVGVPEHAQKLLAIADGYELAPVAVKGAEAASAAAAERLEEEAAAKRKAEADALEREMAAPRRKRGA